MKSYFHGENITTLTMLHARDLILRQNTNKLHTLVLMILSD